MKSILLFLLLLAHAVAQDPREPLYPKIQLGNHGVDFGIAGTRRAMWGTNGYMATNEIHIPLSSSNYLSIQPSEAQKVRYVTNITEYLERRIVYHDSVSVVNGVIQYDTEPTGVKQIVTTVVRRETLEFGWHGPQIITLESVSSCVTNRLEKKETWEPLK